MGLYSLGAGGLSTLKAGLDTERGAGTRSRKNRRFIRACSRASALESASYSGCRRVAIARKIPVPGEACAGLAVTGWRYAALRPHSSAVLDVLVGGVGSGVICARVTCCRDLSGVPEYRLEQSARGIGDRRSAAPIAMTGRPGPVTDRGARHRAVSGRQGRRPPRWHLTCCCGSPLAVAGRRGRRSWITASGAAHTGISMPSASISATSRRFRWTARTAA